MSGYRSVPPTPCLPPQHETREGWLTAAGRLIVEELFIPAEVPAPTRVRVTLALTQGGRHVLGECYHGQVSADGTREITVSAVLDDPAGPWGVLAVLAHELLHAALPEGEGHRGDFAKLISVIGLNGPPTSTTANDDLQAWFRWTLIPRLGRFPHASLNPYGAGVIVPRPDTPGELPPRRRPRCKPPGQRPQRNRQLLYECPECGQKIRAATRTLNALCAGQGDDHHDPCSFQGRFPAETEEVAA